MITKDHQNVKVCVECGGKFVEKEVSIHFECEHCIGRHDE